jgi:hypothetical protein
MRNRFVRDSAQIDPKRSIRHMNRVKFVNFFRQAIARLPS